MIGKSELCFETDGTFMDVHGNSFVYLQYRTTFVVKMRVVSTLLLLGLLAATALSDSAASSSESDLPAVKEGNVHIDVAGWLSEVLEKTRNEVDEKLQGLSVQLAELGTDMIEESRLVHTMMDEVNRMSEICNDVRGRVEKIVGELEKEAPTVTYIEQDIV